MEYDKERTSVTWKDIDKYFGKYQVSNTGMVKKYTGEILNQYEHPRGYKIVSLKMWSNQKTKLVHRVVAETFIDNPEGKPQINHINCIKVDNRVSNLEWCTASENMSHASENGLLKRTKYSSTKSKLSREDVLQIRSIHDQGWFKAVEIADAYGVSGAAIGKIVNRKSYKYL